jgi:hypothetical protein
MYIVTKSKISRSGQGQDKLKFVIMLYRLLDCLDDRSENIVLERLLTLKSCVAAALLFQGPMYGNGRAPDVGIHGDDLRPLQTVVLRSSRLRAKEDIYLYIETSKGLRIIFSWPRG